MIFDFRMTLTKVDILCERTLPGSMLLIASLRVMEMFSSNSKAMLNYFFYSSPLRGNTKSFCADSNKLNKAFSDISESFGSSMLINIAVVKNW